ncbi:molybdopterin guanine dinucleotide synthesis [Phaeobacter sp. PT47_59]|uniref:molybdopterin guanine dinucleotide synthesis n=1 Tax=Phaeobacter sp. PT47_59 TaxID=3029979 RepID=UPI0023807DE4|nr:molybdopterin guanine dinucleotide synthesis [Phaeobacter sp. PT47_59]MDE4174801.1 molybdopterin guanine dinucleotide synthesis [Phaeobacter sp. PT47_59]
MTGFDTFAMVDWSGGNDTGAAPGKDAIWACAANSGGADDPRYFRNRQLVEDWLCDRIETALHLNERLCLGFDFPFAYPAGFAKALTGQTDPLALWDWFEARIEDAPGANNRFDIAGEINRRFGGQGPFWGNGLKRDIDGLPRTKRSYRNPFAERRRVEQVTRGTSTCWQMSGAGSVGGQVMMGLPVLARLRRRFAGHVAAWPFEPLDSPVALVEIWPSLTVSKAPDHWIKDAWQVQQVALELARRPVAELNRMLDVTAPEEGWILGVEPI